MLKEPPPPLWAYLPAVLAVIGLAAMLDPYSQRVLTLAMLNAITVLGLNIVFGYCGLIHLGQAAFVGLGAYGSALLSIRLGLPPVVTIPLAAVITALAAALISLPILRLRSHYLALATVGIGVSLEIVFKNWTPVTGGYDGIGEIPGLGPALLATAIIAAVLALMVAAGFALRAHRFGRAMIAIRDDELAAEASGVPVTAIKVAAFALGCGLAALSGALYAHYAGFISPSDFSIPISILLLVMLIVGGEGRIYGVLLGATVLTVLPELLRDLGSLYLAVFGLIALLVLIFMPQGIAGRLKSLFARRSA